MSDEDNKTEDFQEDLPVNTPEEAPKVEPHKKSKKKLVAIIVACIVIIAVGGAAVFAGPTIRDVFSDKSLSTGEKFQAVVSTLKDKITNKSLSPDERVQKVITNLENQLTTQYDQTEFLTENDLSNISSSGTFTIKLGDTIMAMLPEEYANLSDISGQFTANTKDTSQAGSLSLGVAGKQLVSLNAITKDSSNLYIQIPELSNNYLTLDLASSGVTVPDNSELLEKIKDKEAMKSLITSSLDTVNKYITDIAIEENVKVTVDDIECTYDKLTLTLNGEQFKNLSKELTTVLSKEPIITSTFEYLKSVYSQAGSDMPEFSLDELLKDIDDSEMPEDLKVTYNFYLNKKNEFKGLDISLYENGTTEIGLNFMLAQKDDTKTAVFTMKDDAETLFDVISEYTNVDGVCNGSLTGTMYTDGVAGNDFTVEFSDLSMDSKTFKGTFICSSSALKGAKITISVDNKNDDGKMSIGITMAGSSVLDASFDITNGHDAVIPEIDASASTFDAVTQYQDYLNTCDLLTFIQKITEVTGIDIMSMLYGNN